MSIFHTQLRFSQKNRVQSEFLRHLEALSLLRWNEHSVFQHYQIPAERSLKVMQFLEVFVVCVLDDIKRHPDQTEEEIAYKSWEFVKKGYSWLDLSSAEIMALLHQVWKSYPDYSPFRTYSGCVEALTGKTHQPKDTADQRQTKEDDNPITSASRKTTRKRKTTKSTAKK